MFAARPELSALPLLLYGHSWGGYAADCIGALEPFPIRGIVSAAGFYGSLSALAPYTRRHYGPLAPLPLLGIRLYQRLHFGRLAGNYRRQGAVPAELPGAHCPERR